MVRNVKATSGFVKFELLNRSLDVSNDAVRTFTVVGVQRLDAGVCIFRDSFRFSFSICCVCETELLVDTEVCCELLIDTESGFMVRV